MDIKTGSSDSYRVKGSSGEGIFKTGMENALVQYHDIVCDNSSIYALYLGMKGSEYGEDNGNHFIHQFDWDGNFIANYLLSAPVASLWLDPSSDILYGYDASDDALYRIKHIN